VKASTRAMRRALVALAAAGVTVLSVTAAAAATSHPASPAAAPRCLTRQLAVWYGEPSNAYTGHFPYEIQFSNISKSTCTLFGFPGVSWVNASGHQVGPAAGRDRFYRASIQRLAPDQTVHALLTITDPGVLGCVTARATALKIFPPNTRKATFVPFSFRTCKSVRDIRIRAVRAGAGIPALNN
jgi:hypothetical protein